MGSRHIENFSKIVFIFFSRGCLVFDVVSIDLYKNLDCKNWKSGLKNSNLFTSHQSFQIQCWKLLSQKIMMKSPNHCCK